MNMPNQQQPQWKVPQSATPSAIASPISLRVLGIGRGLTRFAGLISLGFMIGEATLPLDYKPSTLIGRFHGRVEGADATAKVDAVPNLTRKNAEAASEPPAYAGMETEAFRQQQQVLADSLQTQGTIANTADAACFAGKVIPRDNLDWGWLGALLSQTCGVGDQVRQDMMTTLKRGGQDNSVLIQRPRANGSGSR